jgi:DUF2075 family protein
MAAESIRIKVEAEGGRKLIITHRADATVHELSAKIKEALLEMFSEDVGQCRCKSTDGYVYHNALRVGDVISDGAVVLVEKGSSSEKRKIPRVDSITAAGETQPKDRKTAGQEMPRKKAEASKSEPPRIDVARDGIGPFRFFSIKESEEQALLMKQEVDEKATQESIKKSEKRAQSRTVSKENAFESGSNTQSILETKTCCNMSNDSSDRGDIPSPLAIRRLPEKKKAGSRGSSQDEFVPLASIRTRKEPELNFESLI